jgi:hypothetical protein
MIFNPIPLPFRWEAFVVRRPAGVHRRIQRAGYTQPLTYRRGVGVHAFGFLLIVCRRPEGLGFK